MPPRSRRQRSPAPEIDPRWLARPVVDPAAPPVVHPEDEGLHPFLRFSRDDDRADRDKLLYRGTSHGYEPLRPIHWTSLEMLQLDARVRTTCGPHWCRLFGMDETVCTELAVEFFSTIHLLSPLTDYEREDALTFRLGGEERRLSIHQFAVLMGLYTEEEIDTPAFRTELTDWPPTVKAYEFWTQIGIGAYSHPVPKSTKLRDPLHRLLHRAITFSLASCSSSSGSVTLSALFYMYSIITGTPCQLAVCLARYLFSIRQGRSSQLIHGGGYIHRLARAMDILTPADFAALTLTQISIPIDLQMMIRIKMARKEGARHILLGLHEQPWVEPREGEDEADRDRQDVGASGSGAQSEPQPDTQTVPEPDIEQPATQRPRHHSPERREWMDTVTDTRARMAVMEEIQRLECEHAEAYRLYHTRVLRIIASGSTETFPDPPERPQRLTDLLAGASTSGSHHQPPP